MDVILQFENPNCHSLDISLAALPSDSCSEVLLLSPQFTMDPKPMLDDDVKEGKSLASGVFIFQNSARVSLKVTPLLLNPSVSFSEIELINPVYALYILYIFYHSLS